VTKAACVNRRSALILRFRLRIAASAELGGVVVHEFIAISRGLQNEADSLAAATREGNRGTTLHLARSAHTPHADSSGKPLRVRPAHYIPARRPGTRLPGSAGPSPIVAIPPPAKPQVQVERPQETRTNDLEARRDDGHTQLRGKPTQPLDTKRHSLCAISRLSSGLAASRITVVIISPFWVSLSVAGAWRRQII
jgi:hypothetical protein